MARVPETFRIDGKGEAITEGRICRVKAGSRSILLSLRGAGSNSNPAIHIDEKARKALGLGNGKTVDFEFRQVGWLDQFLWAWDASDPAYRIAARLGLLSLVLGIIGFVLGIVSLAKSN